MDELDIKGKKYISSKRAAEITGYAKDYIGQLARSGKIVAVRFGRAWYVEEKALSAHVRSEGKQEVAIIESPLSSSKMGYTPVLSPHLYKPYNFPRTWGEVRYMEDDADLYPQISKAQTNQTVEKPREAVPISISPTATIEKRNSMHKIEDKIKRIQILEDGIIRREQVVRVPEPKKPAALVATVSVYMKKRKSRYAYSIPAWAVAASFAFFLIGISGFFLSSETQYMPAHQLYTASVLPSFDHILGILSESDFLKGGLASVSVFFVSLRDSFSLFLKAGFDFLKSL